MTAIAMPGLFDPLAAVLDLIRRGIAFLATVYTDVGENHTADVWDGTVSNTAIAYYIGWGTGTNTAAKGDTALQTESSETRATATKSQPSSNVNRHVGTITATGTRVITEAGLFTAVTVGNMLIRGDFSAINLLSGDSIQFTIDLTWS